MKGSLAHDGKECFHKRHREWMAFDKITMELVERYKTSGMSGDEWRFNVYIQFWCKGVQVHHFTARDMEAALWISQREMSNRSSPISDKLLKLDENSCDQPGCPEQPVGRFVLKEQFSTQGEKLDAADQHFGAWRKFCRKHIRRGDCGREDSDDNYIPIDGIGPDGSTNTEESPSGFGGFVHVDTLDRDADPGTNQGKAE